ncbi:nucleotide exchange factor GrpE [Acidimicrobiaceae bacterium]|jgi:molecular chaperone GrpE|nr:nucleotide exchange factor GrpE [bacterium]MDA9706350.1 nucleotide exchange factor GrpE [Acidimicrobiaceae bacterium]MEC7840985.1 nucleotide exchange factor GrpE [Actinomycetota bacterium]MDA9712728.1 nucleotide exchange factor GrpE [Acidimicrobiaceae bacterium]MDC2977277.1 nucleotide exchange factor GrpE [Acidimicrobiaceae bacterium]|tara:strand:- start:3144 stop:3617 length:474 start_codon:yes stop_codon:yes gene_type:complete
MSNKDEASSSEELKQNQETNTVTLDEYEKIKDDYLRLAADFENFKKRNEKEKESASFNFVALFVNSLFPLIDNFEIAIKQDNNPKEIESLYKTLQDFMDNLNIVEVPGVGEAFDPNFHEAVEHSGDGDTQTIEEVLRKGYTLEDKLLRPAMVRVKSE